MNEKQQDIYDGLNNDADYLADCGKAFEESPNTKHVSNRYYAAASQLRRAAIMFKEEVHEQN